MAHTKGTDRHLPRLPLLGGLLATIFLAAACNHTSGVKDARPYTKNLPAGTWKVGEIYELKKRAYFLDDTSPPSLHRPEEYTGLAKYESDAGQSRTLGGVLKAGTRYRIIKITQGSTEHSAAPFVNIKGLVLDGEFKGSEVLVATFSDKKFIDGEYGLLIPPDPDRVKRIQ